jgi:hypothetical protein
MRPVCSEAMHPETARLANEGSLSDFRCQAAGPLKNTVKGRNAQRIYELSLVISVAAIYYE